MGIWKETAAVSTAALLGLFLLPLALTRGPARAADLPEEPVRQSPPAEESVPQTAPQTLYDGERTLQVLDGDTVREMTLADYLVGVTAAEMPASFAEEALKAQAVAARTYTLYKLISGGNHGDTADICTDSTCCQAYIAPESAQANWGENAESYTEKIRTAVAATDGEAILYGGVPILAVENIEGYIPWEGEAGCFALRVRGDSMIGAGILDGDKVVVRPQQTATNGEIVVALLEDSATVKRFQKTGKQVWLLPENPAYQPIDGNEAQILGKVKAVIRTY